MKKKYTLTKAEKERVFNLMNLWMETVHPYYMEGDKIWGHIGYVQATVELYTIMLTEGWEHAWQKRAMMKLLSEDEKEVNSILNEIEQKEKRCNL